MAAGAGMQGAVSECHGPLYAVCLGDGCSADQEAIVQC